MSTTTFSNTSIRSSNFQHQSIDKKPSFSHQPNLSSLLAPPTNPRTLSIRFAPLPDPRASKAYVPGCTDDSVDAWWAREERPDGTWGDYRLVVRRPNGDIVAVDDLPVGSHERTEALEAYLRQQSKPSFNQAHITPSKLSNFEFQPHHTLNGQPSNSIDPHPPSLTENRSGKSLLPTPLLSHSSSATSTSSNLNSGMPTPTGSGGSLINPLTLTRTTSCESTCSNQSFASSFKGSGASSITRKFIEAMKKPLSRNSHHLTPTNSLPLDCPSYSTSPYGAPLCKTRSADSVTGSARKRLSFGLLKLNSNSNPLRRTRSKEESLERTASMGFDEPPTRRRSNYPPVAQRKAHVGGGRGGAGRIVLNEEPEFVEWKPVSATPSPGVGNPMDKQIDTVEDDGSGMAWLRKRKKEREERARLEEEERARCLGGRLVETATPLETIDETNFSSDMIRSNKTSSLQSNPGSLNLRLPVIFNDRKNEDKEDDDRDSTSSSNSQSSILSRNGAQRSGGTRTSESSATASSENLIVEDEEDLNEEELKEEERLKALALTDSPFLKGATEVYRDREHHQVLKKSRA